jgi:putative cardiolipin synthase
MLNGSNRYLYSDFNNVTGILMIRSLRLIPLLFLLIALLSACATGPVNYPRQYSEANKDTADTQLGQGVEAWHKQHPGVSGFYPLVGGNDAFGARLSLIDIAERSIDAQYFLMKNDMAGLVFVGKLLEAADRGVHVRLLLDDVFTSVNDEAFLLIDQHPNIELRLFNPVGRGGSSLLNFLADFDRANRRMHNKSFTVDNQVTIVGGRNIAEEYFALNNDGEFRDLDILALGPVATEVSKTFDRFWNHELSVPVEAFRSGKETRDLAQVRAEFDEVLSQEAESVYRRATGSQLMQDLFNDRIALFPANAEVITDDPDKLLNKISADQQILVTRMAEIIPDAEEEVIVITPYLIPGKDGIAFWDMVTDQGVDVIMLTNSLASNNHIPVHAGYARYRHRLIDAGIELYEMRVDAVDLPEGNDDDTYESVTLHTKAIIVDRRYLFVGSLNLDPRSIDINTEIGVLIDSENMTGKLVKPFLEKLPSETYRVVEDENGRLRWHALIDGKEVIESSEPQASTWRRFKAFMSRVLPESQL